MITGLLRVRTFVQDDAHIFCTPDQIQAEVTSLLGLTEFVLGNVFGFEIAIELSTRPDTFIGTEAMWDRAEAVLEQALAERFDLHYTASDGTEQQPVVIHRTILGSIERFLGVLIEHYGGAFPTWLAPEQVRIIPVSDQFNDYAETVAAHLHRHEIRVHVDDRREGVGYKVRDAETQKIPYMVVVGERELGVGHVCVRSHVEGELGSMEIDHFARRIADEGATPRPGATTG